MVTSTKTQQNLSGSWTSCASIQLNEMNSESPKFKQMNQQKMKVFWWLFVIKFLYVESLESCMHAHEFRF